MDNAACLLCVSRRQDAVEMHDIILTSNEELPDYLSILRNDRSFSDNDFLFADSHLNGLVL